MSNEINLILTNSAAELIPKVLNGKTLNFTRMAVGDGFSYNTEIAKGYKTLVNEVLSLDITKKEILSPSNVKITSAFKNTDAQKEFYYREVGLFAQDPDTGEEVLYAYGNRNDAAELIIPTGANIVTKQLIFIIAVGDSAKVTFNVNADVYALQEDMLDVQENKADKNLANTGMITNCLLEIPQRIKLDVIEGNLILKAGSVAIVPMGLDSNGEKIFQYSSITEDLIFTRTDWDTDCYLSIDTRVNMPQITMLSSVLYAYSGEDVTPEEQHSQWYDTKNNLVKYTDDAGITWNTGFSLPIAIVRKTPDGIVSITQTFNGMGYIGSTIWVDKGVKGLIPNGRNPDGTLNNIEFVTSSLHMRDYSNLITDDTVYLCFTNYYNRATMLDYKIARSTFWGGEKPISGQWWFDPDSNYWYFINDDVDDPHPWLNFAKATFNNGVITSFIPNKPFNAIDKTSDRAWLSKLAMPSGKYVDYTLDISGTNYIAPFNGWFAIRKVAGIATAGVSCAVYNATVTTEIYRQTIKNSVAEDEVAMIIPILQGQVLQVSYDATGETIYFRFIYAQGEVN